MKIYVNKREEELLEPLHSFQVVPKIKDAEALILIPDNIGVFQDLLLGVQKEKDIFIYLKSNHFSPIVPIVQEITDEKLLEHIFMEKDLDKIIEKLEEIENGKVNNGKTRKLL